MSLYNSHGKEGLLNLDYYSIYLVIFLSGL